MEIYSFSDGRLQLAEGIKIIALRFDIREDSRPYFLRERPARYSTLPPRRTKVQGGSVSGVSFLELLNGLASSGFRYQWSHFIQKDSSFYEKSRYRWVTASLFFVKGGKLLGLPKHGGLSEKEYGALKEVVSGWSWDMETAVIQEREQLVLLFVKAQRKRSDVSPIIELRRGAWNLVLPPSLTQVRPVEYSM